MNGQDVTEMLSLPARCDVGETVTVEFNSDSVDMMIYMFDYVRVYIEAVDTAGAVLTDSFVWDDIVLSVRRHASENQHSVRKPQAQSLC